ncbi:hypothetical protein [Absidia glauca]|uniref:Uncharacterized protein n=1 Tax=Absidia glauca TaxID=4829 RepID=A0A168QW70_ABSGL|nr:hypothetical protein [Absidia glauca]
MGATQSKSEPVIFYNQNVPLQFSQGLVDSLETKQKSTTTSTQPAGSTEDVEKLVRQRVAEELERTQRQQQELNQQLYGDMAKQNIDNDRSSVALGSDIDNMIKRVQRNNASRVLDCWQEVEHFKDSVAKAQKQFVATHQ